MEATKELKKVSLFCTEGTSDKVYVLWIEPKGAGFVVQFQYGPRGGWMNGGTKTKEPVPMEVAQKAYDKVLKEKLKSGYRHCTEPSLV